MFVTHNVTSMRGETPQNVTGLSENQRVATLAVFGTHPALYLPHVTAQPG